MNDPITLDTLFDWQEEDAEVGDSSEEVKRLSPRGRVRTRGRGARLPWPPREVTAADLISGATRACLHCKVVYPETPEFYWFRPTFIRKGHGRIKGHFAPSCHGCKRKRARQNHLKNPRRKTFAFRVKKVRESARVRGIEWGFDPEDLREFYDAACCHYCGDEISQRLGLDRIDSMKGYTPGNVVSCCWRCNRCKDVLSVDEWYAHMEKILAHRKA